MHFRFTKTLSPNELGAARGNFILIPAAVIKHVTDSTKQAVPTEESPWHWSFETITGEVISLSVWKPKSKSEVRAKFSKTYRQGVIGQMIRAGTTLEFLVLDSKGPNLRGLVCPVENPTPPERAGELSTDDPEVFKYILRMMKVRMHAQEFRQDVLMNFDNACAFGGHTINHGDIYNLEAAHIIPVSSGGSDATENGLSLSRDLHWAFDQGLLTLRPDLTIQVSSSAATTGSLVHLEGIPIRMSKISPDQAAIKFHRERVFKS